MSMRVARAVAHPACRVSDYKRAEGKASELEAAINERNRQARANQNTTQVAATTPVSSD